MKANNRMKTFAHKLFCTIAKPKYLSLTFLVLIYTLISSCQSSATRPAINTEARGKEDLYIVDCLLPGQIRSLGTSSYMSARRPIRTTAIDCNIRGGEYVAYDRADYRSALNVWLEKANDGDAEAQNYVGEIFEKGLGQEPDYVSAVSWYRRAAEKGNARAKINLGYLYEQGKGVEKNIVEALNLYRSASGVSDDALRLNSETEAEIKAIRDELSGNFEAAQAQADLLQEKLNSSLEFIEKAKNTATETPTESTQLADAEKEVTLLRQLYDRVQAEKLALQTELEQVDKTWRMSAEVSILEPEAIPTISPQKLNNINFGRYYAIIVGNQDYQFLEDLRSPMRDAIRLKEVLENKYGFSAVLLSNADEKSILSTINELYKKLTAEDNLLIYYAGHGNLQQSGNGQRERGYWLPVDAQANNINNWLSNSIISDHMDRLKARSILVVADSCYAGSLGSETSSLLFGSNMGKLSERSIKTGLSRRGRLVISSGGMKPVLDGTTSSHSIFASSLIEILENNNQALRDSMLFSQLSVNVRRRNEIIEESATPKMQPVRTAGHEGGSFFFIPKGPTS